MTHQPDNTQPIPASHEYGQAELVEAIMELNNMGEDWDAQHIGELIADWHNKQIAKARRSERLEVALDNYRGQTFSESTDYKSKFDKFVRNNERRIEQLKEHKGSL